MENIGLDLIYKFTETFITVTSSSWGSLKTKTHFENVHACIVF